jgi:hypothetical protein
MKAYLLTHLILYAIALVTTKPARDPYTPGEMALLYVLHLGAIIWTAYLMWNV